jgi:amino-acid N-acetyltransferase
MAGCNRSPHVDGLLPMTGVTPRLRPAAARDRAAIRALLERASLPTADLDVAADLSFWAAADGDRLVGVVGLERYGAVGLLRSLVVAPEYRDRGLGVALVAELERAAHAAGVERLVLLTQTRQSYFERLGYVLVDRAEVPDALQATAEFRTLCPSSAACLTKALTAVAVGVRHG